MGLRPIQKGGGVKGVLNPPLFQNYIAIDHNFQNIGIWFGKKI